MADVGTTSYRCCHPQCPGYPYKASEIAHPPNTCTDEGRLRARARALLAEHPTANNVTLGNVGSTPVASIIDASGHVLAMVDYDVGCTCALLLEENTSRG